MRKKFFSRIAAVVLLSVLLFAGCRSDRKYDSGFESAQAFAEYWCGPCKEVSKYTVTTPGGDVTVHRMQDLDFGYVYSVEETEKEYNDGKKIYVSYMTPDFLYYYIGAFLEKADLSDITSKYGLTIEQEELREADYKGLYFIYIPSVSIYTDLLLTDLEAEIILDRFIEEMEKFDTRGDLTREDDNACVFFTLFSAPEEDEAEVGNYYHTTERIYGYAQ